jgi:hypothetical protein
MRSGATFGIKLEAFRIVICSKAHDDSDEWDRDKPREDEREYDDYELYEEVQDTKLHDGKKS